VRFKIKLEFVVDDPFDGAPVEEDKIAWVPFRGVLTDVEPTIKHILVQYTNQVNLKFMGIHSIGVEKVG